MLSTNCFAQKANPDSFVLIRTYTGNIASVAMDNLDNLYIISSTGQIKILNGNGLVYLADTANGVFVFDNYGSFKRKIPLKNFQTIAVANNNVISANNELITVFNPSTQLQAQKKIPFFNPYFHSFITPS